jgi:hypothetical protein
MVESQFEGEELKIFKQSEMWWEAEAFAQD